MSWIRIMGIEKIPTKRLKALFGTFMGRVSRVLNNKARWTNGLRPKKSFVYKITHETNSQIFAPFFLPIYQTHP